MNVIRRPREHSLLFGLMALAVPIFILNLWVVQKIPFSKLFHGTTNVIVGIQAFWTMATLYFLLKAKRYALIMVALMSFLVIVADVYLLLASKNYALAFYALFIVIISALFLIQAYRYLSAPYYSSGRHWYEGLPRFIPNIRAVLIEKDSGTEYDVRLTSLSIEGCFCFSSKPIPNKKIEKIRIGLADESIESSVETVSSTSDSLGLGFRFRVRSADLRKDLEDFIYNVRCSGYADN